VVEVEVDDASVVAADAAATASLLDEHPLDLLQPPRDCFTDATLATPPVPPFGARAVVAEFGKAVAAAAAGFDRARTVRIRWTAGVLAQRNWSFEIRI
jgi:hypothetical protein